MPSVNDILNVAEALEKCPVGVVRDNCVAVRNRNASCRRCVDSCAECAIGVRGNELDVSASLCVACGACSTACPTGALLPPDVSDADLARSVAGALGESGGRAVFACARIASKRIVDPSAFSEVACLARVDESIILLAVERGARSVLLVDGDCFTCKFRGAVEGADSIVSSARSLLAAVNSPATVERLSSFPDDMPRPDADRLAGPGGTSRRGFFSEAASAAKDTALTAAKVTVAKDLADAPDDEDIGQRLRVTESGTLPLICVSRHETAMNALDAIGEPGEDVIESRLFASVSFDAGKCNGCGMCVMFCPTGALRRCPGDEPCGTLEQVEFSASDCVNCGLCVDVCWKEAVELSHRVSAPALFDFEPVTFDLR